MLMLPEIIVSAAALLLLILEVLLPQERVRTKCLPLVLVALVAAFCSLLMSPQEGSLLGGRFVLTPVAWWFKLCLILAAAGVTALSLDAMRTGTHESQRLRHSSEYFVVMLFNLVGMLALVSSRDLVTLYVSLELASIPLFLLAAWIGGSTHSEAGIKYVFLGALSSALLIYGLGLLYGLSGSTSLVEVAHALPASPALWLALAAVFASVGFKMALVPFQLWAPDVYEGAPTPVTAYLSLASKATGLVLAFALFFQIAPSFLPAWAPAIAVIAACTMTFGNAVAVVQQNIKRFMAFSSISQAGYLLLGFLGPTPEGVPAMLFYLLAYVVTNVVVFAVIIFYANATGKEEIRDYAGLSLRHPLLALAVTLGLFSLAGIPPLSGFTGKFFLFSIASKQGYHWLVALAAINSTISLYYYLRVVRQIYIEPARNSERLRCGGLLCTTLLLATIATVALGLLPMVYETIHQQTIAYLAL